MRSVLEQTLFNIEVVVVNDGSTDDSMKIVEKFKDRRIKIISNAENMGISCSLNRGIQEARGEYIARMDADDYAMPFRFASQVKYLTSHPEVSLCATSVVAFGDADWQTHNVDDDELLRCNLLVANPFVHPSVMLRKKDFEKFNLHYDPNYDGNEDLELWQRASKYLKLGYIDSPFLMYRKHNSSITSKQNSKKTQELRMALLQREFSSLFDMIFSRDALWLLTQSDNVFILSPSEIKKGFDEICMKFVTIMQRQKVFNKSKLALMLLRHVRWIHAESLRGFSTPSLRFRYTSVILGIHAGIFSRLMKKSIGRDLTFSRVSNYARMFLISPRIFMRKIREKISAGWNEA
jgi:glycosyltransferase involved in cell wall biosynthesis